MKYVIDSSLTIKWYMSEQDTAKALRLRLDFITGLHELHAPDSLLIECSNALILAEQKKSISTVNTTAGILDLPYVGIALHPSAPLLERAAEMARIARLTIFAGLYLALAEREQCQFLTADKKIIRNTRKQFPFVADFAAIP